MQNTKILISLLRSPKSELNYNKRSKVDFFNFIAELRLAGNINVPIEVYPLQGGHYYISDGVHRAKAAELAGLESIQAIIYNDSKSLGQSFPISQVKI